MAEQTKLLEIKDLKKHAALKNLEIEKFEKISFGKADNSEKISSLFFSEIFFESFIRQRSSGGNLF